MIAIYGGRWTSQFGESVDVSGQWAQTLRDVSREQIAKGINVVQTSERGWPPTAPEFRAMCLNSGTEHPSAELAYAQLLRYMRGEIPVQSIDRVLYHAISRNMDYFQFKQMPQDKAIELFKFSYRAACEQAAAGHELAQVPPPVPRLERQAEKPASQEVVAAARAKLREMLLSTDEPARPKTPQERADDEKLKRISESQ